MKNNKPESLREALELSIEMWSYMVQNNEMDKEKVVKKLWNDEIYADCWLCEYNELIDNSGKCECIMWSKDEEFSGCPENGTVYREWSKRQTKENAQKVLNHLKSEYERLFPEKTLCDIITDAYYASWVGFNMEMLDDMIDYVSNEIPTYSFSSDKPNWSLLCADLFEDNIPLAFISSGERHYVAAIWNETFEWDEIFKDYIKDYYTIVEDDIYDIFEVNSPEECKELAREFTQRYREYHKGLRRKACNRSKKLKKAKTWDVYSYGN